MTITEKIDLLRGFDYASEDYANYLLNYLYDVIEGRIPELEPLMDFNEFQETKYIIDDEEEEIKYWPLKWTFKNTY